MFIFIGLFLVMTCLFGGILPAEEATSEIHKHENVIGDIRYVFIINQGQIVKAPHWKPSKEEPNPPVSADLALSLANEGVARIELRKGNYWQLDQIALRPINPDNLENGFVYYVKFRMATKGFTSGIWPEITFPILMDGTRIDPILMRVGASSPDP